MYDFYVKHRWQFIISFVIGIVTMIAVNSVVAGFGFMAIALAVSLVITSCKALPPAKPQIVIDMDYVDDLDGHEFEYFCADVFRKNGFTKVNVTQGSGDHGIDIFATYNNVNFAIQCKHYQGKVGNKAVQEAFSGACFYGGCRPAVITNSYYTPQAMQEAERLNVILWDRSYLLKMLNVAVKNSGGETMYNPQQGIYPPGQYLVGTDIPLGSYYLTVVDTSKIGIYSLYTNYANFRKDEEYAAETFNIDYHISLRNKGDFVVFNNCNVRLVKNENMGQA